MIFSLLTHWYVHLDPLSRPILRKTIVIRLYCVLEQRQAAQCVGRVIRSKADYGMMIFADKRYYISLVFRLISLFFYSFRLCENAKKNKVEK